MFFGFRLTNDMSENRRTDHLAVKNEEAASNFAKEAYRQNRLHQRVICHVLCRHKEEKTRGELILP